MGREVAVSDKLPGPPTDERRKPLEIFECYAQDVITFHIVRSNEGSQHAESTFHPDYTHQAFGEDEKIYGYKDLKIDIWLHETSFETLIETKFSRKAKGRKRQPDDLDVILKELFPAGFSRTREQFDLKSAASSQCFGHLLEHHGQVEAAWKLSSDLTGSETQNQSAESREAPASTSSSASDCQIVKLDLQHPDVRSWHKRLQPLVHFFIDNGQLIDNSDPQWELYVAIERSSGGSARMAGFCTVYRFYHYPDSSRLRISQVLVLPPYQRKGHGKALLSAVSDVAVRADSFDVTVEDPSDELQCLREAIDVGRLLHFTPAVNAVERAVSLLRQTTRGTECGADGGRQGSANFEKREAALGLVNCPGEIGENMIEEIRQDGQMAESGASAKDVENGMRGATRPKIALELPRGLVELIRKQLKISKRQVQRCWEDLLFLRLAGYRLMRPGICNKGEQGVLGEGETEEGLGEFWGSECWQQLVMMRLHAEEFGNKEEQVEVGKRVIDFDNVHNEMVMFMMAKHKRRRLSSSGTGEEQLEEEGEEGAARQALTLEQRAVMVQEGLLKFYEARELEVQEVAKKVHRMYPGSGWIVES